MQKRIIISNGKKYIVNCAGWDDGIYIPDNSLNPTSSVVNFRMTEDNNFRITEDGSFRILET